MILRRRSYRYTYTVLAYELTVQLTGVQRARAPDEAPAVTAE